MGKKSTATSKQTELAGSDKATTPKQKTPTDKASSKKKTSLREKAVKTVAAVAMGVGGAIAASRKRTSRKQLPASPPTQPNPEDVSIQRPTYTTEDIALRAYYISEQRRSEGRQGDAHQDWLQAERELREQPSGQRAEK